MGKILIVDEDPGFAEIIRMILEANGYEVSTSVDGDEAPT
jgi:DNA-binding response OmpR family regulator